jgi:hypothetical protein
MKMADASQLRVIATSPPVAKRCRGEAGGRGVVGAGSTSHAATDSRSIADAAEAEREARNRDDLCVEEFERRWRLAIEWYKGDTLHNVRERAVAMAYGSRRMRDLWGKSVQRTRDARLLDRTLAMGIIHDIIIEYVRSQMAIGLVEDEDYYMELIEDADWEIREDDGEAGEVRGRGGSIVTQNDADSDHWSHLGVTAP